MDIVLYYAPNTCALAPYVTLTEAGATFEARALNFRKGQQKSPDYLRLNPKHKVPLLIVDGQPLTESTAIQIWIARNFPQAKLLPADPWQELKAISILSWCSSGIHPFLARINNPPRVCDLPGAEESVVKAAREALFECYKIADDMLAGREFFFDHFTAAKPTSSGASAAARSSASMPLDSRTAPRTSNASRSGRACRSSWPSRRRCRRSSPRRLDRREICGPRLLGVIIVIRVCLPDA